MRTTHGFVAVAMVAGTLLPTGAAMAELRVWTTVRTEHVLRSAPPGNDLTVSASAARNQWRSFQVLLRADRPVKGVSLKAGELRGPQGRSWMSTTPSYTASTSFAWTLVRTGTISSSPTGIPTR